MKDMAALDELWDTLKMERISNEELSDLDCIIEYSELLAEEVYLPLSIKTLEQIIEERNIDLSMYAEYFV